MERYTVEIYHIEGNGFNGVTVIHYVSYFNLLEIFGLIKALKFPTKKILVQTQTKTTPKVHIEDLIINKAAEKLIGEL